MDSSYNSPTTKPLYKGIQIVWYLVGLVEIFLVFRFILKCLGANPDSGFASFIYGTTQFLATPFLGIVNETQTQGIAFEWATLLAMVVYWFAAWAVVKLFLLSKTVSTFEAAQELNKQEEK